MLRSMLLAALVAVLAGCGGTGEAILTPGDTNALAGNIEGSIETQQRLGEFAFAAARGDLDISSYFYDPPREANGYVGTVRGFDALLPFGVGDFEIVFTAAGDGGPVDPYVVDLRDDDQVSVDAVVNFVGTSLEGKPLDASGDFTLETVHNEADSALSMLDGTFAVALDGYDADFVADQVEVGYDLVSHEVTSVTGDITGTVDIPNFAFDAYVVVEGLGDSIQVAVDVLTSTITYTLGLTDLL